MNLKRKILSNMPAEFLLGWITGYVLDYTITTKNPHLLRFERNLVFPALYKRFGVMVTLLIHFTVEALIVLIMPVLFMYDFGLATSSVVALAFGVSHIMAYASNCKFGKKFAVKSYKIIPDLGVFLKNSESV